MSHTTDQIESELNNTRHAIGSTLEELGRKLSPGQLVDEVLSLAKGQTGAFVGNLGKQVAANPIPVALIATGVAWLVLNKNSGGASHTVLSADDWDIEERYRRVEQARWSTPRNANESEDEYHNRLIDAQGIALQLKQNTGEAMHAFRDRVRQAVSSLESAAAATRARLSSAFQGAVQFSKDQAQHAMHAGQQAARSTANFYDGNPLAAGAIAAGIGAILGSSIPLSSAERNTLQGVADSATRLGANLAERGADLAERGAHAVQDRAQQALN